MQRGLLPQEEAEAWLESQGKLKATQRNRSPTKAPAKPRSGSAPRARGASGGAKRKAASSESESESDFEEDKKPAAKVSLPGVEHHSPNAWLARAAVWEGGGGDGALCFVDAAFRHAFFYMLQRCRESVCILASWPPCRRKLLLRCFSSD